MNYSCMVLQPLSTKVLRFGLFRFRSPLLTESLNCFLFLRLLRCFSSPGCLSAHAEFPDFIRKGFPIRKSTDQSSFATPRSLSQLTTSFIGSESQGIHHAPLFASKSLVDCRIIDSQLSLLRRSFSQFNPTFQRTFVNFEAQRYIHKMEYQNFSQINFVNIIGIEPILDV